MKCPKCHSTGLKTVNSRTTKSGYQTWRRKQCQTCKTIITSYEKPDLSWLTIEDPSRKVPVPYNRFLLTISILNAFEGENASADSLEALVDTLEMRLINHKGSLSSQDIVATTLKSLKPVNLNAYLKYLAAHTSPHNQRELNRLIKEI